MTPKELGYYFPAEWEPHAATWLSWPHKASTWPGKLHEIYRPYALFVKEVAAGERVNLIVADETMKAQAEEHLAAAEANLQKIHFFFYSTDDAWCRDYGPAFLLHHTDPNKKALIDWQYNAWGGKYPPYEQDDHLPQHIANCYKMLCFKPGIVMEGGSIEVNGANTLLTTASCLLNPNRNPQLTQEQIEGYLINYYGVEQVLWLGEGIIGDDTDGHVDDLTRFVNAQSVVSVIEEQRTSPNYQPLQANLKALQKMRLANGKPLTIIELPMPALRYAQDYPLPCSYANFYICNAAVIVPLFQDPQDQKALDILSACFPEKRVVGVDSTGLIWGLGSFHCLSQQEPASQFFTI